LAGPDLDHLGRDRDGNFRRGFRLDLQPDGGGDPVEFLPGQAVFSLKDPANSGGLFPAADHAHIARIALECLRLQNGIVGMAAGHDTDIVLGA